MLLALRLLMFAILAVVLWKAAVLVLRYVNKPKYELKCETCRHCEMIDQDGVMCRYGDTVTLKTYANVNMCMDYAGDP
ncbi:MAG: hypothetical protein ABFS42_04910 [Candidatus Krumholzibacteriota bacterium]